VLPRMMAILIMLMPLGSAAIRPLWAIRLR
jgi:hypothetical protein